MSSLQEIKHIISTAFMIVCINTIVKIFKTKNFVHKDNKNYEYYYPRS